MCLSAASVVAVVGALLVLTNVRTGLGAALMAGFLVP
eukprot:SAG22_NODE_11440_length_485_cov_0.668394_1_plen_36_part_10